MPGDELHHSDQSWSSPRPADDSQNSTLPDELVFSSDVGGVDRELLNLMSNVNLSAIDNR